MEETADAHKTERFAAALTQLEALLGQPQVADDYVHFRLDLARAQQALQGALAGAAQSPAIALEELSFDGELLEGYFAAMCTVALRNRGMSEELGRIRVLVDREPGLLAELARLGGIKPDGQYLARQADRCGVPAEALRLFAHLLAGPFVANQIAQLKRLGVSAEHRASTSGSCRHCGAAPAWAKHRRDDNKRLLVCSLCGQEAEFPRMRCAFCGTEDQQQRSVLLVDEDRKYWVEGCDQCKQYLKCLRESEHPEGVPLIPFVEEAATLHLDILAEEHGFKRRLPCAVL